MLLSRLCCLSLINNSALTGYTVGLFVFGWDAFCCLSLSGWIKQLAQALLSLPPAARYPSVSSSVVSDGFSCKHGCSGAANTPAPHQIRRCRPFGKVLMDLGLAGIVVYVGWWWGWLCWAPGSLKLSRVQLRVPDLQADVTPEI